MATNQEENIMRFMNSQKNARRLIQMDANGDIDRMKKKAVSEGKVNFDENGDVQPLQSIPQQNYQQNSIPQTVVRNNNLPPEILESMMSNKIDTTALGNGTVNGSVLDQLNTYTNGKLMEDARKENKPKKVLSETVQPNTTQNIDYGMIKMIVEECMKKCVSSIKKSVLTENKKINEDNSLQAMKIGNKFSFITKNGDLYEAKLKFIKNINE